MHDDVHRREHGAHDSRVHGRAVRPVTPRPWPVELQLRCGTCTTIAVHYL